MYYSQRDPKWGNKLLGNSRSSQIWQHGSMITSMANLVTAFGHERTPDELNDIIGQHGWFDDDEMTNHRAPADLFPKDIVLTKQWHWKKDEEAPLHHMADAGDPNIYYLITIDNGPNMGQIGYSVLVTAFSASLRGMDLMIADPIDGQLRLLSTYGEPKKIIRAAYRFKRAHAPQEETKNGNVWVTMDDIEILTETLFGVDPTDDDYNLEGNSWRHVVMTLLGDPRFRRAKAITQDEAAEILHKINQEDPSEEQIQTFLGECPDHRTAITNKILPALDEIRQQPAADNRPLGDQITDLVNRNR
jgi:hypothetical protein